jgi:hypothetical protein
MAILLITIAMVTVRINKVPSALISGFNPIRVREKITIGKVDTPHILTLHFNVLLGFLYIAKLQRLRLLGQK